SRAQSLPSDRIDLEVQALDAAEHVGREVAEAASACRPMGLVGDPDVRGSLEDSLHCSPRFEAGQRRTAAEVGTVAEGEVLTGVRTVGPELVGLLELAGVPVRR